MGEPVRLRLSRAKGFDLQAVSIATNGLPAVNVARPGKWGNPFNLRDSSHCWTALAHGFKGDRLGRQAASVSIFHAWLMNGRADGVDCGLYAERDGDRHEVGKSPAIEAKVPPSLADIRTSLAGKNLACWCRPGEPCHAGVLLELANRPVCEEIAPLKATAGGRSGHV